MSETQYSTASKDGLWNDLPDLVIAKIFSYLALNDRVSASSVCKSWSKAFESPNLWKSVDIWLAGQNLDEDIGQPTSSCARDKIAKLEMEDDDDEEDEKYRHLVKVKEPEPVKASRLSFSNEKALQFVKKYGSYVKSLYLMCDPITKESSDSFQLKVCRFLKSLAACSCEINELLVFFSYNCNEWEETARKNLIDAFCEFVSYQHGIETLILANYLVDEEIRLLEAVVQGSGSTITNFHCLFYDDNTKEGTYQKAYCKVLSALPNLQFLGLNYSSLSNQAIIILNTCRDLETVYLYNLGTNRNILWRSVGSVSTGDWKKPLKIYPHIQDDEEIDGEYWLKRPSFSEFIPMRTCVYLNTILNFQGDSQHLEVIKYLRKNFSKNLVSFSIADIHNYSSSSNKPLEKAITKLLSSCTELKELRLELFDAHELLEEICKLQFQNKIDLQVFEFRCLDSGTADLDKLMAVSNHYHSLIEDRNWDLQIQSMVYMLTESGRQYLANQQLAAQSHQSWTSCNLI